MKHYFTKHLKAVLLLCVCMCCIPYSLYSIRVEVTKIENVALDVSIVNDGDTLVIIGDTITDNDWGHIGYFLGQKIFFLELQTENRFLRDWYFANNTTFLGFRSHHIKIIGYGAFNNTNLTSVDIPNVEIIGHSAFYNCHNLTEANFQKVKTIEDLAFYDTGITSIDFPEAEEIGVYAFKLSNLTSANLPKIRIINEGIFSNTALTTYSHTEVVSVGNQAFEDCANLTSVNFPKVKDIGNNAFTRCPNLANISFPETVTIGSGAFDQNYSLLDINCPKVQTIGDYAFVDCRSLTGVNLSYVQTIGKYVFLRCTGIETLYIPKVNTIQEGSFNECTGLKTVNLPDLQTMEDKSFKDCSGIEIMLLPTVSTIGDEALQGCTSLKYMELGTPPSLQANTFSSVGSVLIVVPDTNAYKPFPLPAPYSTGSEAHLRRVATENRLFNPESPETLIPARIPNATLAAGGTYVWKKNGYPIANATGNSYTPNSPGWYTLEFTHGGTITLLSVYLASITDQLTSSHARYEECDYNLVLTFTLSGTDRTVTVYSEGSGAAYVADAGSAKSFQNGITYILPKNKSMLEIPYEIKAEEMDDDNQVRFTWQVSDSPIDYSTDYFTLYATPKIKLLRYHRPTVGFAGVLEVEITGGSPYMQRSLDGGETWQWARDFTTGETLPFTQSQIYNLDETYLLFRHLNSCVMSDTLQLGEIVPPSILRLVQIPLVTDAVISVKAGEHYVESRSNFIFTVTDVKPGTNLHVFTSRTLLPDSEGLVVKKETDGSYTVTILYIQEPVIVSMDFSVGNELVESQRVWGSDGMLYLHTVNSCEAYVYTLSGSLVQRILISDDATSSLPLSKGCYLVTIGKKTYKVIL